MDLKRVTDLSMSLFLLVLFSPVLLTISVLILVLERPPILFRQTRIGKNLKRFQIYKFRTMRLGSDASDVQGQVSDQELHKLRGQFQTVQVNDARVTRIGRVLRKTSLDELPQLFNVLKGDMSLVGPRPDVPVQQADYAPEMWVERHRIRPGITGLAQLRGRSTLTQEQRVRYDMEYVRCHGFFLDLKILALTVLEPFRGRGNS